MKKILFYIFNIFIFSYISNSFSADIRSKKCFLKLLNDKSFVSNLTSIVKNGTEGLSDKKSKEEQAKYNIDSNSNNIIELFAKYMFEEPGHCYKDIIEFAKREEPFKLSFRLKIKEDTIPVDFNIEIDKLFDYYQNDYTIFVYNKNKKFGDKVNRTEVQSIYWSDLCSDHTPDLNLDDDAAVNIAGQHTFSIEDSEFYLSVHTEPFYGILMVNIKAESSKEDKILIVKHLPKIVKLADEFSKQLQNTSCSNQGLSVYVTKIKNSYIDRTILRNIGAQTMFSGGFYLMSAAPMMKNYLAMDEITIFSDPYFIR